MSNVHFDPGPTLTLTENVIRKVNNCFNNVVLNEVCHTILRQTLLVSNINYAIAHCREAWVRQVLFWLYFGVVPLDPF